MEISCDNCYYEDNETCLHPLGSYSCLYKDVNDLSGPHFYFFKPKALRELNDNVHDKA